MKRQLGALLSILISAPLAWSEPPSPTQKKIDLSVPQEISGGQSAPKVQAAAAPKITATATSAGTGQQTVLPAEIFSQMVEKGGEATHKDESNRIVDFIMTGPQVTPGQSFIDPQMLATAQRGRPLREDIQVSVNKWIAAKPAEANKIYYMLGPASGDAVNADIERLKGSNDAAYAKIQNESEVRRKQFAVCMGRWTTVPGTNNPGDTCVKTLSASPDLKSYMGPLKRSRNQGREGWIDAFLTDSQRAADEFIKADAKVPATVEGQILAHYQKSDAPGAVLSSPAIKNAAGDGKEMGSLHSSEASQFFGECGTSDSLDVQDMAYSRYKDDASTERCLSMRLISSWCGAAGDQICYRLSITDITHPVRPFNKVIPLNYDNAAYFSIEPRSARNPNPRLYKLTLVPAGNDLQILLVGMDGRPIVTHYNPQDKGFTAPTLNQMRKLRLARAKRLNQIIEIPPGSGNAFYVLPQSSVEGGCYQFLPVDAVADGRDGDPREMLSCVKERVEGQDVNHSGCQGGYCKLGVINGDQYDLHMNGNKLEVVKHAWPVPPAATGDGDQKPGNPKDSKKPGDSAGKDDSGGGDDESGDNGNGGNADSGKINEYDQKAANFVEQQMYKVKGRSAKTPDGKWETVNFARTGKDALNFFVVMAYKDKGVKFSGVLVCESKSKCIEDAGAEILVRTINIDPVGESVAYFPMDQLDGGALEVKHGDRNVRVQMNGGQTLYHIPKKAIAKLTKERPVKDATELASVVQLEQSGPDHKTFAYNLYLKEPGWEKRLQKLFDGFESPIFQDAANQNALRNYVKKELGRDSAGDRGKDGYEPVVNVVNFDPGSAEEQKKDTYPEIAVYADKIHSLSKEHREHLVWKDGKVVEEVANAKTRTSAGGSGSKDDSADVDEMVNDAMQAAASQIKNSKEK